MSSLDRAPSGTAAHRDRSLRLALIAFAAYFVVHIWRHINQTLALGVGRVSPVARVVVVEALVLVSAASFVLNHEGGIGTIYLSMAGSIALLSGWLFPVLFHRGRACVSHPPPREENGDVAPGFLSHERISLTRSAETPPAAELRSEGIPR